MSVCVYGGGCMSECVCVCGHYQAATAKAASKSKR